MRFLIPGFSDEDQVRQLYEESDGADKTLYLVYIRLVNNIQKFDSDVNAEKYAWMLLWTRVFNALQDALILRNTSTTLTIQMLLRSIGDIQRIVLLLCKSIEPIVDSTVNVDVLVNRMRDYAVWCLWSDCKAIRDQSDYRSTRKVFDPNPLKEMKNQKLFQEMYPNFIQMETDPSKLKKQREKYEADLYSQIKSIEDIVNDLGLKGLWDYLERKGDQHKSYIEFTIDNNTSVKKEMAENDIRFGYSEYMKQSNIIHGSTAMEMIYHHEDQYVLRINEPDKIVAQKINALSESLLVLTNNLSIICYAMGWD